MLTPRTLKADDEQHAFAALKADVAVVVAYGLILPKPVLDAPREGCLNLHASALPRWRGAAPIQRAIMAGDTETAATVMRMDEGLDTGPVCLEERVAIGPDMTAGELHDLLAQRGAGLMVRALAEIEQGAAGWRPQPAAGVTYAAKIDKGETGIDFSRPAREVHNHVRGLSPAPGAWFDIASADRQARAHQGAAHGAGGRSRACRHRPGRGANHRLRRGRRAASGAATRRQTAHVGGRIPARLSDRSPACACQPPIKHCRTFSRDARGRRTRVSAKLAAARGGFVCVLWPWPS